MFWSIFSSFICKKLLITEAPWRLTKNNNGFRFLFLVLSNAHLYLDLRIEPYNFFYTTEIETVSQEEMACFR